MYHSKYQKFKCKRLTSFQRKVSFKTPEKELTDIEMWCSELFHGNNKWYLFHPQLQQGCVAVKNSIGQKVKQNHFKKVRMFQHSPKKIHCSVGRKCFIASQSVPSFHDLHELREVQFKNHLCCYPSIPCSASMCICFCLLSKSCQERKLHYEIPYRNYMYEIGSSEHLSPGIHKEEEKIENKRGMTQK